MPELVTRQLVKRISIIPSGECTCIAYIGRAPGTRIIIQAEKIGQSFRIRFPSFCDDVFNFMLTSAHYKEVYIEMSTSEMYDGQVINVQLDSPFESTRWFWSKRA